MNRETSLNGGVHMATDFTFGLTFDPSDKPAAPHAEREGNGKWRALISGIRGGTEFYEWRSVGTYPTCAAAKEAAQQKFAERAA
jgi:hypothetical protein